MATTTQQERELIYRLWLHTDGDFANIYPLFPEIPKNYVRQIAVRERDKAEREASKPEGEAEQAKETPPTGEPEQVEAEMDGNYLDFRARNVAPDTIPHDHVANASSVKTVDDLIEAAGIDLDEWRPADNWQVRTWPTTGSHEGEPWSVRNWYVKASFRKREPEALFPVVQPVELAVSLRKEETRQVGHIRRALILSDPHFGFLRDVHTGQMKPMHDRRALDLALQVAYELQPEEIYWLGDTLDLPDWSDKFLREPEYYWTTQPSILEASWWLGQFRLACPRATIKVLEGNHDARMQKALLSHLPAAHGLRPADEMHLPAAYTLPRLLAMHQMDVEYVGDYPNGEVWLNDNLVLIHGAKARKGAQATVRSVVNDEKVCVIQGHIHREESASATHYIRDGVFHIRAYSFGAMCHLDGRVPGRQKKQDWTQGIGLVEYDAEGFTPHPIPIEAGRAIFWGARYTARERKADIEREIVWSPEMAAEIVSGSGGKGAG